MNSWRTGTRTQYRTYLSQWEKYCSDSDKNPLEPDPVLVIEFLTSLYEKGCGYSVINTARSALSSVLCLPNGVPIGQHVLVKRFLRGVFNCRPALPRYKQTWDVKVVLDYIEEKGSNTELTLKELSLKMTMLLALVTGQRSQTLRYLSIDNMIKCEKKVIFRLTELLKQSRPGFHLQPIVLHSFEVENLCVVKCLEKYLQKTEDLRSSSQLLISFAKPHKPVTTDTISRWLKTLMREAGVDVSVFTGHSTRSASTSAASMVGVPIQQIMDTAGWSSTCVFAKFYAKPVLPVSCSYSNAVLSSVSAC
ncbi:uncharacterized protein LOC124255761 [Haliotis rubra]|uniref:uncharacterized protein LOC124255761 n=1 Tax=Haliotis rubra TaxID=36100 RepID=UPI001EE5D3B0|nr:uncharacterized protein LOC124255761 [Haliotis rubra]